MFNRVRSIAAGLVARSNALAIAGVVGLVSLFSAGTASAQVVFDSTEVIAIVDSATTFITTVGLAVLIMLMVAKGVKWARKAG